MTNLPIAVLLSLFLCTVGGLATRGAVRVLRDGKYVHPSGAEFTGVWLRLYVGALFALSILAIGVSVVLILQALRG